MLVSFSSFCLTYLYQSSDCRRHYPKLICIMKCTYVCIMRVSTYLCIMYVRMYVRTYILFRSVIMYCIKIGEFCQCNSQSKNKVESTSGRTVSVFQYLNALQASA